MGLSFDLATLVFTTATAFLAVLMREIPKKQQAADVIESIVRIPGLADSQREIRVRFRGANGAVGNRDNATHGMHWYPAKMFYRIPRAIISSLDIPQSYVVLDPFCGSGTVLLEAAINGNRSIGLDVNPLARLVSKVKTTPINAQHLLNHFNELFSSALADAVIPTPDAVMDFWFMIEPRTALFRLHRAIRNVRHPKCRDFFLVALSAIVRKSSLADPSIAPPVKLNVNRENQANEKYRRALANAMSSDGTTVFDAFRLSVADNVERMRQIIAIDGFGSTKLISGRKHAANTGLPPESIDLILTSPPYCGAQKYVRSLRLEMLTLGYSHGCIAQADRKTLGTERTKSGNNARLPRIRNNRAKDLGELIRRQNQTRGVMFAKYIDYLERFAAECKRVLRVGGQGFISFGTNHIAGNQVDMSEFFRDAAEHAGLSVVTTLVDNIPSRGLITTRHKSADRIDDERVVWIRG